MLDQLLAAVDPDVAKWATVVRVTDREGGLGFEWHHYRDSETSIDFWPASVVKLYTCIAVFERLNALELPSDAVLCFYRRVEGRWRPEAARTAAEMCSNIFAESTNEDYTLQLRFLGLDPLNQDFFNPAHGFTRTALMRGYTHEPPYRFDRDQPQRIVVLDPAIDERRVVEHTWSGQSYAEPLGAHVLDAVTGNCSPTRDMAECLRRLMFHERLPPSERFNLTADQLELLREGRDAFVGLRNTRHAWAWDDAIGSVFPRAAFYHKPGNISNFYLELCYVHDPETHTRFIAATATGSGQPDTCAAMNRAIAQWCRDQ